MVVPRALTPLGLSSNLRAVARIKSGSEGVINL